MAYPGPFIRLTFGGTLPGPEEWACGLSFAASGAILNLTAVRSAFNGFSLDDVAEDIRQWFQSQEMQFQQSSRLTFVKAAIILPDGSYDQGNDVNPRLKEYAPGGQGYISTATPNSLSLAVTLWSGSNLGKGNFGRFYMPPQNAPVDPATEQVSSATVNGFLAKTVEMLEAVKGEIDTLETNMHLVIATEVGTTFKQVNEVRIGRRMDTQRRRMRSIPEDYVVDSTVDL